VTRSQLVDAGIGRRAIGHRLERQRLHAVYRGVYAVGHQVLSREARWLAAVLALGEGAALSHRSAAAHLGLRASAARFPEVTPERRLKSRQRIRVHHGVLPPDEITVLRAITVTTVPRTLLDLATVLSPRQVERAIEEAEVRRLDDPLSLADLVKRYPGRRGTGVIKEILAADRIGSTITRSELEERFLRFLETHALPSPEMNIALAVNGGWIEADCVWRRQRLIVELDGAATHGTFAAYERDRARDRSLHAAGWRVVRVTWRQLHRDADQLAADLRGLLKLAPVPSR
jgi:very-short-patch-repair endonuclease